MCRPGHGGLELQTLLDPKDGRMVMRGVGNPVIGEKGQQAVAVKGAVERSWRAGLGRIIRRYRLETRPWNWNAIR